MPKTATPRKPETLERRMAETRNTSRNRNLAGLLGLQDRNPLRDMLSAANDVTGRGMIAGFLGLPGDLGGMAENGVRYALGMPQVTPYGGSEHIGQQMEKAGLVTAKRRPVAETLASLISPSAAATAVFKAPAAARAGVRLLDNLADSRGMGRGLANSQVGAIDVGPQAKALRVAQQNAAKPIEEGGLGLRPDNTPEERAAAMGFDIENPMAHGTNKSIKKFKVGKGGYDEIGSGVYTAPIDSRPNGYTYSNAWAQGEGGINYPVVVKSDIADYDSVNNALPTPVYRTPDGDAISPPSDVEAELIQRIVANDPQWLGYEDLLRDRIRDIGTAGAIKKAGYLGARSQNSQVPNQVVTFDPRNIRSRFAAFDPMKRDSSDILAGLAPLGLGAWMYQDEPVK